MLCIFKKTENQIAAAAMITVLIQLRDQNYRSLVEWRYCFCFTNLVKLSLQVVTFIVQKIMLDNTGLCYVCATAERFFAVASVLAHMVETIAEHPFPRLLKHIIRCYLRLTDNARFML